MKSFSICKQHACSQNWRASFASSFSKFVSAVFVCLLISSTTFGQGIGATAVGFEVDANFKSNNIPSFWKFNAPNQTYFPNQLLGDDWSKGAAGNAVLVQQGGVSVPGLTADRTALWQVDGNWGTNTPPELTVFAGSSNKNGDNIAAGQSPYSIQTGSGGPQKNDITNVFLHTRRASGTNALWFYFGAETRSTNGSSYLDFEYNQAGVTTTATQMIGQGFVNGRTVNDLLLVINYTQGGKVPIVGIRKWLATGTWSDELPLPSGTTYMTTNTVNIDAVAPNKGFTGDGAPTSTTIAFQFVEGAVNISALDLTGLDQCTPNATVTVKTRSSPSYTAELKDWDILHFPLTPSAAAAVANITPFCQPANGISVFNVSGTWADGTPTWSTTAGALSNEVYNANGTASATLTLGATEFSANVTLTTVSSNPTCPPAVSTKTATVYPRPTVDATGDPEQPLSILASLPHYRLHTRVNSVLDPASGYTFSWVQDPPTGGSLSSLIIPDPTFGASVAGDYLWTVTVTDANSCSSSDTVMREIIAQAPCPIVSTPPMCSGTTYVFEADVAPAPGETWTWTANNGATVNLPNGGKTVSVTAGTQSFTLTLTKEYSNELLSDQVCPYSVTVNPSAVNPSVSLQTISCTATSFSISITNPQANTTYHIYQLNGNHIQETPPHSNPLVVSGLALSQGYRVVGITNFGCESDPTDCGDFSNFEAARTAPVVKSDVKEEVPAIKTEEKSATDEVIAIELKAEKPSITATPNPFTDRIRFSVVSQVAGYGVLEIHNMMGQKVQTIYQGNFEALKPRVIDYNVPFSQRTGLVYTFRVGSLKTSGILVGSK